MLVSDKWINRISWLQICLPAALILGAASLVIWGRVTSKGVRERSISPDHGTIAEVARTEGGGATEAYFIGVQLRSRLNPFKHVVFGGLDYGATVRISWVDSMNLIVTCERCENLDQKVKEQQWKTVSIHYNVD